MTFGDFVENVMETPINEKLKQHLDELYAFYAKDSEKCAFYLAGGVLRGSTKNDFLIILPFLLKMYNEEMSKREVNNGKNEL